MKVTVYSTATCPFCTMLTDYLEEKSVEYEEKLVDQDENAKLEMMSKSEGYLGVPFSVVTTDNGEVSIIGFDKTKLAEALRIQE